MLRDGWLRIRNGPHYRVRMSDLSASHAPWGWCGGVLWLNVENWMCEMTLLILWINLNLLKEEITGKAQKAKEMEKEAKPMIEDWNEQTKESHTPSILGRVYVCIWVLLCVSLSVWVCVCLWVCLCVCIYLYVSVYVFLCVHLCICMWVHLCVCVCLHMCVRVSV